ncbi:MAG: tyrosine-type recombinase/integrase [Candidatus Sericytochromatia bacterium]|nr:tyrosine-type recombinase/integrase [Candidatus Tanganyikabacteria bacterium]
MPDRFTFTKARIDALDLPAEGKRALYWDERESGLALRVTAAGARSFYVVRRVRGGAPEWVRLGAYPALTIDEARREAAQVNAGLVKGESAAERRKRDRKDPTVTEVFAWWMDSHIRPKRGARYARDCERQFRDYLAPHLGRLKASKITRGDVRRAHAEVSKRAAVQANRAIGMLRAMLNKAIAHDLIPGPNPAIGIEPNREASRERRLLPGEVPRFLEAVAAEPNADIRDFVLLALYTGIRKANLLEMRWDEIDLEGRIWRIPTTKNRLPQLVPLLAEEVEILARRRQSVRLDAPWVFPSHGQTGHLAEPKSGWRRILDRAGIADLRIHDLRRTCGSFMADADVSTSVIGKALNHLSPAATAIYARLALDPVRRGKERGRQAMLEGIR